MYTLDHKDLLERYRKTTWNYLFLTILCAVLGAVYECFSFGVYSYFMLYAFAVPLVLGVLPFFLLLTSNRSPAVSEWSMKLWHAGTATLTVGSFFQGILEIYGTSSMLTKWYWIAGAVLLIAALGSLALGKRAASASDYF